MAKEKKEAPNFAEDAEFAEKFSTNLLFQWNNLRAERSVRENAWQDHYDMWSVGGQDPNQMRNYRGTADLKLPQMRKEVETMTRRIVKSMFSEDYLMANSDRFEDEELAITNTQVVRHFFDKKMHMQAKATPWIKQAVLYGTSPLRTVWKKEANDLIYKKRFFKTDERGVLVPDFKLVKENITLYDAPRAYTCDMFNTWVYPSTAIDPQELQTVFYRTKVSFEFLKEKEKKGVYIPVDFLQDEGKDKDDQFSETQVRLAAMGDSAELIAVTDGQKMFDLLEVWGTAEMPNGKIIPYVCEIINEKHCIRIQQNPFWHQTHPFDFARYLLAPGPEFYGRGLPEASVPIQHMLNDVLNQSMDSATLSLNSITIVNPAYAPNAESFEIEPRAVWWADPNGVKQMTFPDLSDVGIKNAGTLRGIITEMSDNQPQLPDPIAGKARSTGQAQLAINEWQTDLYSFVNQIIIEALQPLAKKTHSLIQQNLPDDAIIRITGKYADQWVNKVVTPSDIAGNYDFTWKGAIQNENQSVKTQQMLNFLKIYPMIPKEAGVNINWENLIIKLLRDGFGIRDVETVVNTSRFNASVPPSLENRLLDQGATVRVSKEDDDDLHIQEHTYGQQLQKDPYYRSMYAKHLQLHAEQKQKKALEAQMQAQAQAMAQAQMQQQMQLTQMKHPSSKPASPPNPAGNQGQMSQSTNPGDFERGLRG